MPKVNKAVHLGSSEAQINEKLQEMNQLGYRLIQVLPADDATAGLLAFFEADTIPVAVRTARSGPVQRIGAFR